MKFIPFSVIAAIFAFIPLLKAAQPRAGGVAVIQELNGVGTNTTFSNLGSVTGARNFSSSTNATFNFTNRVVYWNPLVNCRFQLTGVPTATNVTGTLEIILIGAGIQVTNVVDTINGAVTFGGTTLSTNNHIVLLWNGVGLEGWLDPGVISGTQLPQQYGAVTNATGNPTNGFSPSPVFTGTVDIQQAMKFSGVISPPQITANQNDYGPTGLGTCTFIRLTSDAARNITGLVGQSEGTWLQLINIGSFPITLKNSSGSSASTNVFAFISGDFVLEPGAGLWIRYTAAAQWRAGGTIFLDAASTISGAFNTARLAGGTATSTFVPASNGDGTATWVAQSGGGGGGGTNGMTVVNTNFISGQLYTNTYGYPIGVWSPVTVHAAAISGNAYMELQVPGTTTNRFGMTTFVTTIAMDYPASVIASVPVAGTYTFTNTSSGAGNTGALVNGGQIFYVTAASAGNAIATVSSNGVALASTFTNLNFVDFLGPTNSTPIAVIYNRPSDKFDDPQFIVRYFSEFANGTVTDDSNFRQVAAGSGSIASGTSTANHPGVWTLSTLASTTGSGAIFNSTTGTLFGGGKTAGRWIIKTPSALSDGTDTYVIGVGFNDSSNTATPVDAAQFRYVQTASTFWQYTCASNSVLTTATSSVTVATSTWYLLEVVVNAAGTSVDFIINGTLAGTTTTNIPIGAGRELGMRCFILKSAGTNARAMDVDYASFYQYCTSARY